MRLLAFDDDVAVGRLLVRIAAMAGIDALAVTDPDAFCHALCDLSPHVVMLDLQLGHTDGIEQLRLLAQQRYRGAVILMSGFDSRVLHTASTLARSMGLQLEGVLEKPIGVPELEAMLARLQAARRVPSLDRLLAGIHQQELTLEFQPIVSRHPRRLEKLEALVRWNHPELGRLGPADFLATAEAAPVAIDALTQWVCGAAAEAWRFLQARGLNLPIAVNVSSRNLHDLTLPDRMEAQLHAAGMPCDMLYVEITETAAFSDATRTMDVLSRLRLKGMHLALDDFGTGYASLKLLRQMPFSVIKIDQSFVADMVTSRDANVIVKCIIDLARNMEMACVAEGVETEQVAEQLEALQVNALQGYLIAPSMPLEAVPLWASGWREPSPATQDMVAAAGQ